MNHNDIPVFSLTDLARTQTAEGFEIAKLEKAFGSSRQNVLNPHRHDFFEVFWIPGGSGKLSVDFDEYHIEPPMLLLFSPGRVHAWQPAQTPQGYVIRFEAGFFAGAHQDAEEVAAMPIFYTIGGDPVLYLSDQESSPFPMLTEAMFQEFGGAELEKQAALRSYLRLFLIYAKRIAETRRSQQTQTPGFYLTRRFLHLVELHYRQQTSLDFYASQLKVTPNHLTSTVKANLEKTAGEVLRERLLVEAKRLLRYSEQSVAEIAFHLNFEDPSYFARFFRKHTGQTPTDFRQEVYQ